MASKYAPPSKYRVDLHLTEVVELVRADCHIRDGNGYRTVLSMHTGPFDDPESILATIIELIDHAEWHGEQLTLPVSPGQ